MKMIERFVFDTNTLVSAFLFKNSIPRKALIKAIKYGNVVASVESFAEFNTVFSRSKFDKYLKPNGRLKALKEIADISIFIEISEHITACRDPKDDKFLELALAAKASCIITSDEDLLILNPFRKIPILNASDFLIQF
jgi:putative PIN family toxin of toxin-antitoxin system